jgi:hypothetical protein
LRHWLRPALLGAHARGGLLSLYTSGCSFSQVSMVARLRRLSSHPACPPNFSERRLAELRDPSLLPRLDRGRVAAVNKRGRPPKGVLVKHALIDFGIWVIWQWGSRSIWPTVDFGCPPPPPAAPHCPPVARGRLLRAFRPDPKISLSSCDAMRGFRAKRRPRRVRWEGAAKEVWYSWGVRP